MSSGTGTSDPATNPGPKRRGRRRGSADTRDALLRAAREVFIEQGYDGATVRAIATGAGVDAAMVNHWFGGKEGLFTAAISLPINPAEIIPELLEGDRQRLGERIVRRFLTAWDAAGGGEFTALVRSVAAHEAAVRMLREFVTSVMFGRIARALDNDQPELRAALCGSQIIGLGVARYVAEVEPLASSDHDTLVTAVAPTLQRYLTGPLD